MKGFLSPAIYSSESSIFQEQAILHKAALGEKSQLVAAVLSKTYDVLQIAN